MSKTETELLSCGAVSVLQQSLMTVLYLSDEHNFVEKESSPSIFLRASRFDLNNTDIPIHFLDVAKANTTWHGYTCSNVAPYEPNIVSLSNGEIIGMFRDNGMKGNYISFRIGIDELTCYNFKEMTINGLPFNAVNVGSIFKQKSGVGLGEVQSIALTTQIIEHDGYYYSHVGGYGYNGMIIRSKNGIDWETITIPSKVPGLSYILEGAVGKDSKTGNYLLCARGDKVALYLYDSNFNEIDRPKIFEGVTTSKPTFFNYRDNLYLIVNMENDTSFSIGRRNTANIYKVNGQTGELTRVKTLKCKEGCAYHTVQVINDIIWIVFQTDARHIALEDQGRSNLALYRLSLN